MKNHDFEQMAHVTVLDYGNTRYEHAHRAREVLTNKDVLQSIANVEYLPMIPRDDLERTDKESGVMMGHDTAFSSNKLSLNDEEYLGDNCEFEKDRNIQQQCDVEILAQKSTEDDANGTFAPGDLVWAKVKSHPWWPGQVFNAMDASKAAKKIQKSGRILVAFFGDGTFGWLQGSQLIAFRPNFEEKVKQTTTKSFFRAVTQALEEVCRRSELGLACSHYSGLLYSKDTFVDANAGIQNGVKIKYHQDIHQSRGAFTPERTIGFIRMAACFPSYPQNFSIETSEICGHAYGIRSFLFGKVIDHTLKRSLSSIEAVDKVVNEERKVIESPQLNNIDGERKETKRSRVREDISKENQVREYIDVMNNNQVHEHREDVGNNNQVHESREKSQIWRKQEKIVSVENTLNVHKLSNKETLLMKRKCHVDPQEYQEKKMSRIQQPLESGDQQLAYSGKCCKVVIRDDASNIMKKIKKQDVPTSVFLSGSIRRIKKQVVKEHKDPKGKHKLEKIAEKGVKGSESSAFAIVSLEGLKKLNATYSPGQPHSVQKHERILKMEKQTSPLSSAVGLGLAKSKWPTKEKNSEGHSGESHNFTFKKTFGDSSLPMLKFKGSNYIEEFGKDDVKLVEVQKYPVGAPNSKKVKMGEKKTRSLQSTEDKITTIHAMRKDSLEAQVSFVHSTKEVNEKYHARKVSLSNNEYRESKLTKVAYISTSEKCNFLRRSETSVSSKPSDLKFRHSLGYLLHGLRVLARDPLTYARERNSMQYAMNMFLKFRSFIFLKSLSYGTHGEIGGIVEPKEMENLLFSIQNMKSEKLISTAIESSCEHNNVKAQPGFQVVTTKNKKTGVYNSSSGKLDPKILNTPKNAAFQTQTHSLQQRDDYLVRDRGKKDIQFPPQNSISGLQALTDASRNKKSEVDQTTKEKLHPSGNPSSSSYWKNIIHVPDSKAEEISLGLFIRFPQDFTVPSETHILKVFSQFGPLEIRSHRNSSSAQVVFKHNYDAEAALMHSLRNNLFGAAVSYKLRHFSRFQKIPTNHDTSTLRNENDHMNGINFVSSDIKSDPALLHEQTQTQSPRGRGFEKKENGHVNERDFVNSYTPLYPPLSHQQIQDQTLRVQVVDGHVNGTDLMSLWKSQVPQVLLPDQKPQIQSQTNRELEKTGNVCVNEIDFMTSRVSPDPSLSQQFTRIQSQGVQDLATNENAYDFVSFGVSHDPPLPLSHQQTRVQSPGVQGMEKNRNAYVNGIDFTSSCMPPDPPLPLSYQQTRVQGPTVQGMGKDMNSHVSGVDFASSCISPDPPLPLSHQQKSIQSPRVQNMERKANAHVNEIGSCIPYHQAVQSTSDNDSMNINNNPNDLFYVTAVNLSPCDIKDRMMKLLHAVSYIVSSYSFNTKAT